MEGNTDFNFFFSHRNQFISWVFNTEFDYSAFTDSELREIKAHTTLEQFAIEQKIEEREEIFRRAREYDKRVNCSVVQVSQCINRTDIQKYTRYANLEDALRHLLWGKCKLGVLWHHGAIYVMNDIGVWSLKLITRAEDLYVPKEVDKQSQEYLKLLQKNKILRPIGKAWLYDKETKEDFFKKLYEGINKDSWEKPKYRKDKESNNNNEEDSCKDCREAEEDKDSKAEGEDRILDK